MSNSKSPTHDSETIADCLDHYGTGNTRSLPIPSLVYIVIGGNRAKKLVSKRVSYISSELLSKLLENATTEVSEIFSGSSLLFIPTKASYLKGAMTLERNRKTDDEEMSMANEILVVGEIHRDENFGQSRLYAGLTKSLIQCPGHWYRITRGEIGIADDRLENKVGRSRFFQALTREELENKFADQQLNIKVVYLNDMLEAKKGKVFYSTEETDRKRKVWNRENKLGRCNRTKFLQIPAYIKDHMRTFRGKPPFSVVNYKRHHRTAFEFVRSKFP